jgi:hypothetical protein
MVFSTRDRGAPLGNDFAKAIPPLQPEAIKGLNASERASRPPAKRQIHV